QRSGGWVVPTQARGGMPEHLDLLVTGGSAGAIEALNVLVRGLPPDLRAAIAIVVHMPPAPMSILPEVLNARGPLRARFPRDGDRLENGQIFVALPDHHLVIKKTGRVRVLPGPRQNRHRPAIDPLFRSAAHTYGTRTIA